MVLAYLMSAAPGLAPAAALEQLRRAHPTAFPNAGEPAPASPGKPHGRKGEDFPLRVGPAPSTLHPRPPCFAEPTCGPAPSPPCTAALTPGFMRQLELWHAMGCRLAEGHVPYKRYLLELAARRYQDTGELDPAALAQPSEGGGGDGEVGGSGAWVICGVVVGLCWWQQGDQPDMLAGSFWGRVQGRERAWRGCCLLGGGAEGAEASGGSLAGQVDERGPNASSSSHGPFCPPWPHLHLTPPRWERRRHPRSTAAASAARWSPQRTT